MQEGAVDGLNYTYNLEQDPVCTECCEGKQNRLPFKNKRIRSSTLLETIHADLCGPMEVPSLNGSRYFLLFADIMSRMIFVYFLKTQDEALQYFRFKSIAENQCNGKIKIFGLTIVVNFAIINLKIC